ncbi:DNA polymerase-3 subunit delta [Evansella vedderi]|uniref:DNA polymerase III subunit delta n=1 Tax=Evansella vedderi TaxID=38282 RepID=A0ABT9ZV56_9BACI|nr:DNA polymerase III subunit delta [Evansella vedderi]MDQ0254333.1 DNA polymerase-3 subunit delta [Evansella vedderi]
MAYIDVLKSIKKGNVAPIYLLSGTEHYIIEDTLHLLIKQVLTEEEREFNLSKFDMKEYPIELAVEEAYTFPFMGGKRVVIVKDAFFFSASKDTGKMEHDLKKLEAYLQEPAPETVFVILAPYDKLDERKKIVKLAKKNGQFLDGSPLEERDLKLWVMDRGKENNVHFNEDAIEHLITLTGAQLMLMASEIKKISIHIGEGGTITKELVEELVPRSLEQNIFALVEGVVKREIDKSWKIYLDLLKQKEEPIKIIALMVRQFRILYQVKQLSQQGYSQKQMASQLKLHPYVVKLAGNQARQFKDEELLGVLNDLANMDYEIKTGKIDKVLAVELFFSKRAPVRNT